jgi:integrase/recombinase XerC
MTLSQALESFTVYLQANRRSPQTISCYRRDLVGLLRYAGDLPIEGVTPGMVQAWVASDAVQCQADGRRRKEVTINRCKSALRAFGSWLADVCLLARSPASGIQVRRTDKRSPSFLSDPERKRMLREVSARKGAAAARDRIMLELMLGTGIRLAELVGLDIGAVDLDAKRLTVRVKGGRTETRFLNTDLRILLRRYLRTRLQADTESPALFLSNRRDRISARQVQARFQCWLAWAGIQRPGLSVHSLRHTFGTRLYRKTHDLVLTGRALGHRTTEATLVYVHEDTEALEEALESL